MISEYKQFTLFEDRFKEANNILKKYHDKIPVILEKYKSKNLKEIDKKKYLLPKDLLISQLLFIIKKRINISSEQCIYMFCNNILLSSNNTIEDVYYKYKDDDKFLYIFYDTENTFGYKH